MTAKGYEIQMKDRSISAEDAQRIINVACPTWRDTLATRWAKQIVLKHDIEISEGFYKEMRKACTSPQNVLFDDIFGKDVEVFPDGTPCLVKGSNMESWQLRYADGTGRFYYEGRKSGPTSTWSYSMKLDINNLPVNE